MLPVCCGDGGHPGAGQRRGATGAALLSCPFVLLTLGLFLFVINAFTLWLSARVAATFLDIPFPIERFAPALLGGIIVSIVSWGLNLLLPDPH